MEKQNDELISLGSEVWEYRKEFGFSKKLPESLQRKAVNLCRSGTTAYAVGKALGIPRNTISEWVHRYQTKDSSFSEVSLVDDKSKFAITLSGKVQDCEIQITGTDYSLLQRLFKKLSH